MKSDKLTAILEEAGLSSYQANVFVTLLDLGSASATDIAQASDVPDPRIYDVLRGLEEKGYIETYEQERLRARAHDPADVLADLRSQANRFETAAEEIEDRWSRPDIEEHKVSFVKRFDTVLTRADELIRTAETQVQIGLTPAQFDDLFSALVVARENGVDIKLCLFLAADDESELPSTEALSQTCTEARYCEGHSPFVALVDQSWTCFSPHGASTNEYGIIVNDRTHTYIFNWYFMTCLWSAYEEIYSARSNEPPITYVDLRQCLRDVEPLLEEGRMIEATISGFETETGHKVRWRGTITDITYGGVSAGDERATPLTQLLGKVSLTLATDGGTYTVSDRSAVLEDYEVTRITIEAIE